MGRLTQLLNLPTKAVAIYRTDYPPDGVRADHDIHCIIGALLMPCAREGKTVYAEKADIGCSGAFTGLGFGGDPGRELLYDTYSAGIDGKPARHYFKDPEVARNAMEQVPVYGDGSGYVVFQPLEQAEATGAPIETVVFIVDPVHLSALVTLAGYDRISSDACDVRMIHSLSCEQIYALPRSEGSKEYPRAVIGLTELYVRCYCNEEELSFAVPYPMYRRMEANAGESFLSTSFWVGRPRDGGPEGKKVPDCCAKAADRKECDMC